MSPCLSDGGRTSSAAEFPANREKNWEIRSFWPIFGKTVAKSPTIQGGSRKIPYAREQGDFFTEQGIKVPCSAENRDIPRLVRRLFDAPRASAAGRNIGAQAIATTSRPPLAATQIMAAVDDINRHPVVHTWSCRLGGRVGSQPGFQSRRPSRSLALRIA